MKTKGNIHKIVNMNNYIHSLQNEYNIITYAESSYLRIRYIKGTKQATIQNIEYFGLFS